MRCVRILLALALALVSLATVAVGQSEAQKSFDELKTLAGVWRGTVSATPAQAGFNGNQVWVILRVTSRGNAIVHEIKKPGTPDDIHHDDPVTMIYMDDNRLTLVHYCDAGNRPRMVADNPGNLVSVDFSLQNISGSTQYGHMNHATFNLINANHHTEDWTFIEPGNKPVLAHMDLQRVK